MESLTVAQFTRRGGRPLQHELAPKLSRAKRALECGGPPQDGFAVANLTPLCFLQRGKAIYRVELTCREMPGSGETSS